MGTLTAAQLKRLIGQRTSGYWSTSRRTYAGFFDPVYRPLPGAAWRSLVQNAPQVSYRKNVYDCEDHAMQFKAWAAKTQVSRFPAVREPFCLGLAMGLFAWVGGGRQLHVANFALLDDRSLVWFDLRSRKAHPFGTLKRRSLEWVVA